MPYYQFQDYQGQSYGSFEVFFEYGNEELEEGWYWWSCFPSCLPDSDPFGPFDSEDEAFADAMEA